MSAVIEENGVLLCASCGVVGGDDIKLKNCDDCDLVKYCSDECQKEHRPDHEQVCEKRAAELYDEILFKQPESNHYGDCPICCLPIPLDPKKSTLYQCCSKIICNGCNYVNQKREYERRLQNRCPFCRCAAPKTDEECIKQLMKRIEANDPVAMRQMGTERFKKGNYESAFEYWARAAALGDAHAHFQLSGMYREGKGVEKDMKRVLHHLKEAAIGGHPEARYNLAYFEDIVRLDRAAKHWIIAANLGHDLSLECLKDAYTSGFISKEDFAAALRGHHTAIKATKSPQREEAAKLMQVRGHK